MSQPKGRLVILCGPSCVGKSPLAKALGKFHPEWFKRLQGLVLYNSRSPRPGELDGRDYHFRMRSQIEAFRADKRYALLDVRGDLQALDLEELQGLLSRGDVIFEGNPFVGMTMLTHPHLKSVGKLSVFLSPLSKDEVTYLTSPERNVSLNDLVTDIMRADRSALLCPWPQHESVLLGLGFADRRLRNRRERSRLFLAGSAAQSGPVHTRLLVRPRRSRLERFPCYSSHQREHRG